MWKRLLLVAACAGCVWACGDDSSADSPSGPNFAGSCNREAEGLCDEYANDNSTATTQEQCTSSGGTWTDGQCPFEGRMAVCGAATPATRTYAYTDAAAASLMSTCPADNFKKIEAAPALTGGAGGTGAPILMTPDASTNDAAASDADASAPDGGA